MTKAEELFHTIASGIPNAKESKMFGALCIKAPNGKAGVMFWKEDMIFKLEENDLKKALGLKGAKIFTPMENRPMNGWVQLSYGHSKEWKDLAKKAMAYVRALKK
jgi:hypothetical protein